MMKKNIPIEKKFKMPHLYKDDVEEIIKIITSGSTNSVNGFKLQLGDYIYENINELPDNKMFKELYLTKNNPYLLLRLYESNAYLYIEENNNQNAGMAARIVDIINKREHRILWWMIMSGAIFPPIIFGLSFSNFILSLRYEHESSIKIYYLLIYIFFSLIWYLASRVKMFYRYSIIEMTFQNNKLDFYTRNKDQILMLIIGTILGVILTYIISNLLINI